MTNLEACLKKFWKRLDEWVMIFWPSTGGQSNVGCNRTWVHVWCGAPGCIHSYIAKGLQKRLGGSWLSPPLIVTQSYWCGILRDKFLLVASYPESFNDKGQEVIISYNTYPTSASTSTTWLGEKCGCTYPPERGHLSVNIHCPPSNRSGNYWSCFENEAGGSDQKLSFDLSYLCESTRRRRRQDMSYPIHIWTQDVRTHTNTQSSK